MKILLLNNSHLPMIGGKEIVVHQLATQFTQLGHDVRVAGPSGYRKFRNYDFGYPVDRFASIPGLSENAQWTVRATLILLRRRYDVIHAHTTHPSAYAAKKAQQRLNITTPLVITPHGADIHKVPEISFGKRLNPELDKKIRWALTDCDSATAISDSVRHSLIDAGASPDVIASIPNGVDTDRFETVSDINVRSRLGLAKDTKLIVSTGNYHPRKGHEVLIEALEILGDDKAHLAIIGRQNSEFVRKVKAGPVGSKVTFEAIPFPVERRQLENDLLAAILQQADLYVSASRDEGTEGLSLAVLEAMAAGCCTVVTDVSGNRDVVTDHESGRLVAPNSAEQLARAISETLLDEESRRSMAAKAKTQVTAMSWRAISQQYLALFEQLIARKKLPL